VAPQGLGHIARGKGHGAHVGGAACSPQLLGSGFGGGSVQKRRHGGQTQQAQPEVDARRGGGGVEG
jgi:hypothetical protein